MPKEPWGALRGYRDLNTRALRLLANGGYLFTGTCSHHVSREDFLQVMERAVKDARVDARIIGWYGAAPDHPVLVGVPETEYLKMLLLAVE